MRSSAQSTHGGGRRPGWLTRGWTSRPLLAAATLALALVLVAGSAPAASRTALGAASQMGGKEPQARAASNGAPLRLGPTDPSQRITLTLALVGQSQGALPGTIAAIHDPSSPDYRHYLTPEEYARRFGSPRP